MQTKEEIEKFYQTEDPWGFKTNIDDEKRKNIIINTCLQFCISENKQFLNALEIGAGEGWITKDLPAENKFGFEISEVARSRWDKKIENFNPNLKYDLIIAPGVFYPQYDYKTFLNIIQNNGSNIVMVISISDWEVQEVSSIGELLYKTNFPYRQYNESLKVYKIGGKYA